MNDRQAPPPLSVCPPEGARDEIEAFLLPLIRAGRSPLTIDGYRGILMRTFSFLRSSGLGSSALTVSHPEMDALSARFWVGAPKYNMIRRSVFSQFLSFHGNLIASEYPSPRGAPSRVNVDWLSSEEASRLCAACVTPLEKLVVHLELKLCLRRVDAMSLTVSSVASDPEGRSYFSVVGKGSKPREVPFVPDTSAVLAEWMSVRCSLLDGASSDPGDLIVYRRGVYDVSIRPYAKTAWDSIVKGVASRAGISRPISNHTLRRTGARMWYKSGVRIEEVSLLLGHSDPRTTALYIGLRLSDLSEAADRFGAAFGEVFKMSRKSRSVHSLPFSFSGKAYILDFQAAPVGPPAKSPALL
jgi:integrase